MAVLTAVVTHLGPEDVHRQLAYLRARSPEARFVVCHGGWRDDFDRLELDDALFIGDPSLRGPMPEQSYNEVLAAVYETHVRDEPAVELVHLVEYDELILAADFEHRLEALAAQAPNAGLFGKYASPRNDTNWPHSTRYRNDRALHRFLAGISKRDDAGRLWGCLGTGLLFRRDALAAFCAVADPPHFYLEMFIPTLVHHLGFDVVDVDGLGDLYAGVRWRPDYGIEDAVAGLRTGRAFLHPFKDIAALDRLGSGDLGGARDV